MTSIIMRDTLAKIWLDYINNYLTVEKFAEHNGLYFSEATNLLAAAKSAFDHPHPDA